MVNLIVGVGLVVGRLVVCTFPLYDEREVAYEIHELRLNITNS